ncbi:DNA repair protein, putative [Hondaea fermentalgiana]|uniref:DNA repair protein, putative n=1 Tax=Hondaea fermentalgiana TaxID=2315210 RepID=A0A2R5GIC2_9STRA|nr:DNA repair protein, putative [Hondaea fermentalgiana]|eukprot:GBG29478.1 DNA repair protein, putative [Hondaea fermentalgiana]
MLFEESDEESAVAAFALKGDDGNGGNRHRNASILSRTQQKPGLASSGRHGDAMNAAEERPKEFARVPPQTQKPQPGQTGKGAMAFLAKIGFLGETATTTGTSSTLRTKVSDHAMEENKRLDRTVDGAVSDVAGDATASSEGPLLDSTTARTPKRRRPRRDLGLDEALERELARFTSPSKVARRTSPKIANVPTRAAPRKMMRCDNYDYVNDDDNDNDNDEEDDNRNEDGTGKNSRKPGLDESTRAPPTPGKSERNLRKIRGIQVSGTGREGEERPLFESPLSEGPKVRFCVGHFDPELPQSVLHETRELHDYFAEMKRASRAEDMALDQGQKPPKFKLEKEQFQRLQDVRKIIDKQWQLHAKVRGQGGAASVPRLWELSLRAIRDNAKLRTDLETGAGQFARVAGTVVHEEALNGVRALKPRAFVPASANRYLMPYQREGVRFLFDIFTGAISPGFPERGGILADVMGLGKTVQVICFLLTIFGKTGRSEDLNLLRKRLRDREAASAFMSAGGPVLLVAPVSVLDNWAAELKRWGYFAAESVTTASTREDVEHVLEGANSGKVEVVLVGYERMRELTMNNSVFASTQWRVVVFDECHRLKNPSTQNAISARRLRARCKIGATGTPVSNEVKELWAIMHVLAPCELGPKSSFDLEVARPLNRGRLQSATQGELRAAHAVRSKLKLTLDRLILRRGKEVIADRLTGKKDTMVLCPLTRVQERVYLRALNSKDFTKLVNAVDKSRFVDREIPDVDRALSIPANEPDMVHDDATDTGVDVDATLWRMQHRVRRRRRRRPQNRLGGRSFLGSSSGALDVSDRLPEEGPILDGLSNADADADADVDVEDDLDNDAESDGKFAKQTRDMKQLKEYLLPKHDSSDDESGDERDSVGRVLHRFRECAVCPKCTQMPAIIILAQIANHLDLIRADPGEEDALEKHRQLRKSQFLLGPYARRMATLGSNAGPDLHPGSKASKVPTEDYYRSVRFEHLIDEAQCGKMQVLRQLLQRWRDKGGIKVLIFSNSLVLLNVLEKYLESLSYPFLRLDGGTGQSQRQDMCKRFNSDPNQFVFLMSTRAGGEGLNLTGASKVVIFDPDWSPTPDLQAQDRAHRLGQRHFVRVYRLISQGTVEEAKYLRQVDKRQLSSTMLEGSFEKRLFKDNEFRGMLELLRYSRRSFTVSISERYVSERRKYVKAGRQMDSLQGKLKQHLDREDVRAKDKFVMFDIEPDADVSSVSRRKENEGKEIDVEGEDDENSAYVPRSGAGETLRSEGPRTRQHSASAAAAAAAAEDEDDELGDISGVRVNWDTMVGDSREEREYAEQYLDPLARDAAKRND